MVKPSRLRRSRGPRELLLRNLAASIILYESVVTTAAKAHAVQPIVERLIHLGQHPDKLHARRELLAYLTDANAVDKIINELVPRFGTRTSGFTRRYRSVPRLGDGAPQVIIQLSQNILLEDEKVAGKGKEATKKSAGEVHDESH